MSRLADGTEHTGYELAIEGPTGERFRIAYLHRKTRRSILTACQGVGVQLVALAGADDFNFATRARDGATVGACRIFWTGRTHLQARMGEELTWIGAERGSACAQ